MTKELTITAADNGIMLTDEDWVQVIENTHDKDGADYDNVITELGKLFYKMINNAIDQEMISSVKVKIEITKPQFGITPCL